MNRTRYRFGIRNKLISIFSLIKVVPLLLLALLAWKNSSDLSNRVASESSEMAGQMIDAVNVVGKMTTTESVRALDLQAQEFLERITGDTAEAVAQFLYQRDQDLRFLSTLQADTDIYQQFLNSKTRGVTGHRPWKLKEDGSGWEAQDPVSPEDRPIKPKLAENHKAFHSSNPYRREITQYRPLYREITFIDLTGQERVKATSELRQSAELRDVSEQQNTWIKAETYFSQLADLKADEIYVSNVIGAYIPSPVIGSYTPQRAAEKNIPYQPEQAAYAGKENPVGKRFEGIIRWAMPTYKDGKKIGYVTMAMDHTHLMEFTDHIVPTPERYSSISDAGSGNYAFMWDNLGRNISHPRDYFIVGYDPETGQRAVPFLEEKTWQKWQLSGLPFHQFAEQIPIYSNQSLENKPAAALIKQGYLGLDCRYLDFAPQCSGWWNLTQDGGAGSFVIFWSGLWKFTTAAAIPYFTGQYGNSRRGFGFVTIGANVNQFHAPAEAAREKVSELISKTDRHLADKRQDLQNGIQKALEDTSLELILSTLIMVILVILIAIWMASYITNRITRITEGLRNFTNGRLAYRIQPQANDEVGDLAESFNQMADTVDLHISSLMSEVQQRKLAESRLEESHGLLLKRVEQRTSELQDSNMLLRQENAERQKAQEEVERLARIDYLTDLPNRLLFNERLEESLQAKNSAFSVLFIDLDKLKLINDNFGHDVGDSLLHHVASCLARAIRHEDTVARLGGDEFAILAHDSNDTNAVQELAIRLLSVLSNPVALDGHLITPGCSIGIARYPNDATTPSKLLHLADMAMYQVKNEGGNSYRFFDLEIQQMMEQNQVIEAELRRAIVEGELKLYYQPKVSLEDSTVLGMEALVRWQHPQHGLLLPDAFIDAAERTGKIIDLGEWVLDEACRQTKIWHQQGYDTLRVSVNVSALQLKDRSFYQFTLDTLQKYDLAPVYLELELTESCIVEDSHVNILTELRAKGVSIAIDDFGIGYSSFDRLRQLKVDMIKVDRSFVKSTGTPDDDAIISAIINMAKPLGVTILAEGVETEAQEALLTELGCHQSQGFFFSKPLDAPGFESFMSDQRHPGIIDKKIVDGDDREEVQDSRNGTD
ncbi:bifunctional diguanylate cyclase/phosphodiesterase [Motiliproteus sp. MSK22-1]|uniref:putative bifunctional diguanylate cyclase/phosphodiesterase n=1 Tax=Motiliproteus sp. MSK22-1 TaxID=1897630 RepID=UPI0009755218|nr:EAL domain-containing protein [Motiliproteus sp. MSK22-1]OMH28031.1 hypothetical protein BGP75_21925 [Motiliproteus sp. MSK22-1]